MPQPHYKEIQVFPMIYLPDGSERLINSDNKFNEEPDFFDVSLFVRDSDTDEHLEDHPDYQEWSYLSRADAARLASQLQEMHPDAGFDWLEHGPGEANGWDPVPVPPQQTEASYSFAIEDIRRALPPLEWTQQTDRHDPKLYIEAYSAKFMNMNFVIEFDDTSWYLVVKNPLADPMKGHQSDSPHRDIFFKHELVSRGAAVDAAETFRSQLIAGALGADVTDNAQCIGMRPNGLQLPPPNTTGTSSNELIQWKLTMRPSGQKGEVGDRAPHVAVWLNKDPNTTVEERVFFLYLHQNSQRSLSDLSQEAENWSNAFIRGVRESKPDVNISLTMQSMNWPEPNRTVQTAAPGL